MGTVQSHRIGCFNMEIITSRLKKTVPGEKNGTPNPTEDILTFRYVPERKQRKQRQSKLLSKGSENDRSKHWFMARGDIPKKQPLPADSRERQRRHVDRLFDISNQLVEESLKTKTTVPDTPSTQEIDDNLSFEQRQQTSTQLTEPNKPVLITKTDPLDDSQRVDTIETSQGSFSMVAMFAGLQCCGFDVVTIDDGHEISSNANKGEKKRGKPKPELLSDSTSIPREISFTSSCETFDTSNYILLSEIEDDESLRASILSRLRCGRSRTTSLPTTRVYVEPPHRAIRTRSLETRALGL